jgi:tetratricopeptide (TPR) repeat protein
MAVFRLAIVIAIFMMGVGTASTGFAHADIDERLMLANAAIADNPNNPLHYLKRGELHRIHRDWKSALSDYEKAATLNTGIPDIQFYTGRMWLQAGQPELAKKDLDRFLLLKPRHAKALLYRGRALALLGKPLQAVDNLTDAIRFQESHFPDLYLERAKLLIAAGPDYRDDALKGLEEGMSKLGPIVTLVQSAIEIEMGQGRYEAALGRLDNLAEGIKNRTPWLSKRGDILLAAGRVKEAGIAYNKALQAIAAVPIHRRKVGARKSLDARLNRQLQIINAAQMKNIVNNKSIPN